MTYSVNEIFYVIRVVRSNMLLGLIVLNYAAGVLETYVTSQLKNSITDTSICSKIHL